MTDIITVNYECNRSTRSAATVNTAGKSLFNWEPSNVTSILDTFSSEHPLSLPCVTFRVRCDRNRNISPQFGRRWFPEACVTRINQRVAPRHGRSFGLGKKGWKGGGGFEQLTSQWTAWQRVKKERKGPLPRVTARSHTVLHLFPSVLSRLPGTNTHLSVILCVAVWRFLTSSFSIGCCLHKLNGTYFAVVCTFFLHTLTCSPCSTSTLFKVHPLLCLCLANINKASKCWKPERCWHKWSSLSLPAVRKN